MSRVSTAPDAPAPASSAGSRVNPPAFAAALAVGQAIGVLPVCFIIGGPRIALRAIGAVAVLTVFTEIIAIRRAKATMSTTKPRPRHYVIAAASAAFHGVVTGYMWLGLYWMLAGLIWLLRATVGWPESDVFAAAATASMYLTLPFVVGSLVKSHREVIEQLCPDRAGVEPVFETAPLSKRVIWILTGIVLGTGVLLFAAAVLQYQIYWLVALLLLVVVMSASVQLATLSSTEKRPGVRDVIDATKRALESAGCEVLPAPRTGDPSVDPLLADLSLYVRAPGRRHAFAIDIKASPTGQPLDWSAASTLKLKVSALTNIESRDSDGDAIETITPVLVALTRADDSLREFAHDHRVTLFESGGEAATTTTAEATSDTSDKTATAVLSNAAVRTAAEKVPELIRAFIERSNPRPFAASSGRSSGSESGGAVAQV
jgi:hypothetical protein